MLTLLGILKHRRHPRNAYKLAGSLDTQDIMESSPQTHVAPRLELLQGQAKIMFPERLTLQRQGMRRRRIHDQFFSRQGIAHSTDLKYGLKQDSRQTYSQLRTLHPLHSIRCTQERSRPLENIHLPILT